MKNCNQSDLAANTWHFRQRAYAFVLLIPSILFLLRIMAQLIQRLCPVSWLPEFSAWHSEAISYDLLLAAQLSILAAMVTFIARLFIGNVRYNPQLGRLIMRTGIIYFSLMLFRLIAGLTFFAHLHWFSSHIPAFFHLILASFLMLSGQLHLPKKGDSYEQHL